MPNITSSFCFPKEMYFFPKTGELNDLSKVNLSNRILLLQTVHQDCED